VADSHEGSAVIVVHHTKKAESDDWMDGTSGTQGINGAADYTVGLARRRGDNEGIIRVVGRDTIDGEYAVRFDAGSWILDGGTLVEASSKALQRSQADRLGSHQQAILKYVNDHPEGVTSTLTAEYMTKVFGDGGEWTNQSSKKAGTYLARLADAEKITRIKQGLYVPLSSTLPHFPHGLPRVRDVKSALPPSSMEGVESVEVSENASPKRFSPSTPTSRKCGSVENELYQPTLDELGDDDE
jgi:hypothetical protein